MERKVKTLKCRILAWVLLVSGLGMLITACSGVDSITATKTETNPNQKIELTVFAGSASKPPLDEAAQAFEKKNGIKLFITYGGSGSVLSQMKLSKTGDIYIPGSPDYLVKAEKDGQVILNSSKIIAYLVPAINVQHGNPKNIQTLSDLTKADIEIGIGNPSSVCVGLYAVEVLDYNQLLEKVYPQIITQADSCDKTATLVALKSVDAVLGWDVFHPWNPNLIDTIYIKPDQLPRLAYIPAALCTYSQNKESAQSFIDYLVTTEGQAIFKKWGYNVTESEVRQFAPQAQIGGEYQLPNSFKELAQ
jgi:molybdate transport system substrate-binding protein